MEAKSIVAEDFINYYKPSMFISCCKCDWKCCIDGDFDISVCQNSPLSQLKNIYISNAEIISFYLNNPITKSLVFGGLEPMLQFEDILNIIKSIREQGVLDDVVIYTGYYKNEILDKINILKSYKNIIIKYGRYIPNQETHYDNVLGVSLASNNQYAEKIS